MKYQNLIIISAFLAVLSLGSFIFSASKAQAAPDSTLYFTPATDSVMVNQNFNLDAVVNPGTNQLTGVSLRVDFDPSKFQLSSINVNNSPFSVILMAASINNTGGTASIDMGVSPGNPTIPVTTTSTVASFSFQPIATATNSSISFSGSSYAVAMGETADVLTARTPATVSVTSGVTYSLANFTQLATDWLKAPSNPSVPSDVNTDGIVNTRDLGIMMSSWQ